MTTRLCNALIRRFRQARFKLQGMQIQGNCWLQQIEVPRNHADIQLHDGVALDRGVTLLATGDASSNPRILIAEGTYINRHTMIDASHRIEIGANCMIGPFVYITDHDHGMQPGVRIQDQPLIGKEVVIEDDVWIGAHATILKGVRIGTGAVVGAGSVVTRDVPPNAVVAGVPAKVMRMRG